MPAFNDIAGQRFGRWMVVSLHAKPTREKPSHNSLWLCRCDCGTQAIIDGPNLVKGGTQSCGCLKLERRTKHGHAKKRQIPNTYYSWLALKQRCTNPNNPSYKNWGARGISVCERWLSYENFLADMGPCPYGFTIERIDVNGNYEPSNCTWIPKSEQGKNKRWSGPIPRRAK